MLPENDFPHPSCRLLPTDLTATSKICTFGNNENKNKMKLYFHLMVVKWFKILMSQKRHVFNVINTSSNVHGEKTNEQLQRFKI